MLKRKRGLFLVGRANSMQACIPHLLDQPNQIAGIGANMKTISREAYFSTVSHLTRIPNDRSSKVKSTRFFIGHGRFLQKHDTKFPKTSIMPYF